MSYYRESAEACLALLKKHEPVQDRIEALRISPASLDAARRQGLIRSRPAATQRPIRRVMPQVPALISHAPTRQAARAWLDQPKPRKLSQGVIGRMFGVSQAGVSIAVDYERKARRQAYLAGNKSALLAKAAA